VWPPEELAADAAAALGDGRVQVADGDLLAGRHGPRGGQMQGEVAVGEHALGVGRAAVVAQALHGIQARPLAVQEPGRPCRGQVGNIK
jgi:hypothetical protein